MNKKIIFGLIFIILIGGLFFIGSNYLSTFRGQTQGIFQFVGTKDATHQDNLFTDTVKYGHTTIKYNNQFGTSKVHAEEPYCDLEGAESGINGRLYNCNYKWLKTTTDMCLMSLTDPPTRLGCDNWWWYLPREESPNEYGLIQAWNCDYDGIQTYVAPCGSNLPTADCRDSYAGGCYNFWTTPYNFPIKWFPPYDKYPQAFKEMATYFGGEKTETYSISGCVYTPQVYYDNTLIWKDTYKIYDDITKYKDFAAVSNLQYTFDDETLNLFTEPPTTTNYHKDILKIMIPIDVDVQLKKVLMTKYGDDYYACPKSYDSICASMYGQKGDNKYFLIPRDTGWSYISNSYHTHEEPLRDGIFGTSKQTSKGLELGTLTSAGSLNYQWIEVEFNQQYYGACDYVVNDYEFIFDEEAFSLQVLDVKDVVIENQQYDVNVLLTNTNLQDVFIALNIEYKVPTAFGTATRQTQQISDFLVGDTIVGVNLPTAQVTDQVEISIQADILYDGNRMSGVNTICYNDETKTRVSSSTCEYIKIGELPAESFTTIIQRDLSSFCTDAGITDEVECKLFLDILFEDLENNLTRSDEEIAALLSELEDDVVLMAEYIQQLADANANITRIIGELQISNDALAELIIELDAANLEIQNITSELQLKDAELVELIVKLDEANLNITSLAQQLSDKETELATLIENLDKTDEEIAELIAELDLKDEELANLISELALKDEELANLIVALDNANVRIENLLLEAQLNTEQLDLIIIELAKENANISGLIEEGLITNENMATIISKLDLTEKELASTIEQLDLTEQELAGLIDDLDLKEQEIANLISELQLKDQELAQTLIELDELNIEMAGIINDLDLAEQEIARLLNEIDYLSSVEMNDLIVQLDLSQQEVESLLIEMEELAKKDSRLIERLDEENRLLIEMLSQKETLSGKIIDFIKTNYMIIIGVLVLLIGGFWFFKRK